MKLQEGVENFGIIGLWIGMGRNVLYSFESKVVSVTAVVLARQRGVWEVLDWMVGEGWVSYLGYRRRGYFRVRTHLSVDVVLCHSESPPFRCTGEPEWKRVVEILIPEPLSRVLLAG